MSKVPQGIQQAGNYLRTLREKKGLTITKVAAALDTGETQIRIIEKARAETRAWMLHHYCELVDGDPLLLHLLITEQAEIRDDAPEVFGEAATAEPELRRRA